MLHIRATYHRCLDIRRPGEPARFLEEAGPLLLADEARHNLILGIAGDLARDTRVYREHRLWIVADDATPVAVALQTPPFNLLVSHARVTGALDALADTLAADGTALPGVTASLPEVDEFAAAWEARAAVVRRPRVRQLIYRLTAVRPVNGVPGRPRRATGEDRPLLVEWMAAFTEETVGRAPLRGPEETVDARLRAAGGGFVLWEDGRTVSLVGYGSRTPNGVRIGPVYTPPDRRRKGYASALTAAVSAEQLAQGRPFCFLYTDVDNPTANHVYSAIGYERVCESVEYAFEPARARS
jgi:uncharacterized protein